MQLQNNICVEVKIEFCSQSISIKNRECKSMFAEQNIFARFVGFGVRPAIIILRGAAELVCSLFVSRK